MILFVGLGNPGQEYSLTRHNIGFEIIDGISKKYSFPKFKKKFDGLISKDKIYNNEVILFKPQKFMNLSGFPIKKVVDFYGIPIEKKMVIFQDDLDMLFSKIRVKFDGSHGGHNGIKNIINLLGQDFIRIKFGIKNNSLNNNQMSAEKFVLKKFTSQEKIIINSIKKKINENLKFLLDSEFSDFINNISKKKHGI